MAGFLCGLAVSQLSRKSWPSIVQGVLLLALFIPLNLNLQILSLLLMLAITVVTAENSGVFAQLSNHSLPYLIGRASFSIYLAHIPVSMVVNPIAYKIESETVIKVGSDWTLIIPIKILASTFVGILTYQWVELRFSEIFAGESLSKQ